MFEFTLISLLGTILVIGLAIRFAVRQARHTIHYQNEIDQRLQSVCRQMRKL